MWSLEKETDLYAKVLKITFIFHTCAVYIYIYVKYITLTEKYNICHLIKNSRKPQSDSKLRLKQNNLLKLFKVRLMPGSERSFPFTSTVLEFEAALKGHPETLPNYIETARAFCPNIVPHCRFVTFNNVICYFFLLIYCFVQFMEQNKIKYLQLNIGLNVV